MSWQFLDSFFDMHLPTIEESDPSIEQRIIEWADDRGIFRASDPTRQFLKTSEEVGELAKALGQDNQGEIEDAIGDIAVTLVILAKMRKTSLEACMEGAYKVIADRTGRMEAGMFVKDNRLDGTASAVELD